MSNQFISKLVESMNELEKAVTETKRTLQLASNPKPELIERISCYEEVLKKQRTLIKGLSIAAQAKNFDQVKRFVDLIKGSSLLIQLDSQSFVSEIHNKPNVVTEDIAIN